jgi:hypothetical protein
MFRMAGDGGSDDLEDNDELDLDDVATAALDSAVPISVEVRCVPGTRWEEG